MCVCVCVLLKSCQLLVGNFWTYFGYIGYLVRYYPPYAQGNGSLSLFAVDIDSIVLYSMYK